MGGFECERVDMKQLVLCIACITGSYQKKVGVLFPLNYRLVSRKQKPIERLTDSI
mgnify:CR=1 FL=1